MRPLLLVGLFLSALMLFSTSAVASAPAWTADVGPGYITTAPVVGADHVFVRTSGFWTGEERPEVIAFSHDGEERWRFVNSNTVQHDMAPLLLVPSGEGACGVWPDMVLVGWADGRFDALSADTGVSLWNVSTPVDGWGITGAFVIDGDEVVFPGRASLHRACLANGESTLNVTVGEGWRNGVAQTPSGYWLGDEAGTLWHVGRNGSVSSPLQFNGSIRHAPVVMGERLLLHVQQASSSTLQSYDTLSSTATTLAVSGSSPAVPLKVDQMAIFGDGSGLTSVVCDTNCSVSDTHETLVNGEMTWTPDGTLHAPINTPSGGWLSISVSINGTFTSPSVFSTPYDGYGTAPPAFGSGLSVYGNDAGVLMVYITETSTPTSSSFDAQPVLGAVFLMLAMGGMAALASMSRTTDAWRLFTLVVLVLALFMLPDISGSWNTALVDKEEDAPTSDWRQHWPDTWLGTQVVVVEFEDETLEVGGLVGHESVLALTQAAALDLGVDIDLESTSLGTYLVAINGTSGAGWEYFVNGERGVLAVDDAMVETPVVLVWRLA